jgi:hypothetical protein
MARTTVTLDPGPAVTATAVKTAADALEFYRAKRVWLSPRKVAAIERVRRAKRRSLRT